MKNYKITIKSPVILIYMLFCLLIVFIDDNFNTFICDNFSLSTINISNFYTLITHSFAHKNYLHFIANFSFILLIGPYIEQKYGSVNTIIMIFLSSFIIGLMHSIFITTGVLGSSGVLYMLIVLTSFKYVEEHKHIPIETILIIFFYLYKEFYRINYNDNISHYAHFIGGITGLINYILFKNHVK